MSLLSTDSSMPLPFWEPTELLILHGEAKSYCFAVSFVPESMFNRPFATVGHVTDNF